MMHLHCLMMMEVLDQFLKTDGSGNLDFSSVSSKQLSVRCIRSSEQLTVSNGGTGATSLQTIN